jgi:Contractile injection system tube protein
MASRARGPHVLNGAFVTVDPADGSPQVIAFTYNPASLRRSLQPQQVGGEEGDRSEAVRFTGAPVQTITIEIEIDATDQLQNGDPAAQAYGALPQISALELLVYPSLAQVNQVQSQLGSGVMEVSPLTAPRTLFVWGDKRVLPVRLNSYEITEEIFDTRLNPIRASATIAMRVLTYSDLDSGNKEYFEFMSYQQALLNLAAQAPPLPSSSAAIGVDVGPL